MFFATLGLVELLFLTVFFVLLVVGITYDRRGREYDKWWILSIGAISIASWYWADWTFKSVWGSVSSLEFWKPIGLYLLVGLGYSVIEFALDIRRSAASYAALWDYHLTKTVTTKVMEADGALKFINDSHNYAATIEVPYAELYAEIKEKGAESAKFNMVLRISKDFIERNTYLNRIVGLKLANGVEIEPQVNRLELAEHISAWTLLWPAYGVSLVLGDFLTEVFRVISDILVNLSGRFVRMSFANVFKI
jgi:hypothetical protein